MPDQLQAADVWAYESRKYVSDVLIDQQPDGQRWQYEMLIRGGRSQVWGFPPERLDALATMMRADSAQASSLSSSVLGGDVWLWRREDTT